MRRKMNTRLQIDNLKKFFQEDLDREKSIILRLVLGVFLLVALVALSGDFFGSGCIKYCPVWGPDHKIVKWICCK